MELLLQDRDRTESPVDYKYADEFVCLLRISANDQL